MYFLGRTLIKSKKYKHKDYKHTKQNGVYKKINLISILLQAACSFFMNESIHYRYFHWPSHIPKPIISIYINLFTTGIWTSHTLMAVEHPLFLYKYFHCRYLAKSYSKAHTLMILEHP